MSLSYSTPPLFCIWSYFHLIPALPTSNLAMFHFFPHSLLLQSLFPHSLPNTSLPPNLCPAPHHTTQPHLAWLYRTHFTLSPSAWHHCFHVCVYGCVYVYVCVCVHLCVAVRMCTPSVFYRQFWQQDRSDPVDIQTSGGTLCTGKSAVLAPTHRSAMGPAGMSLPTLYVSLSPVACLCPY